MGVLSDDLREMGYDPTDRESPFDDNGKLWTKGYEAVCDETGIVIRDEGDSSFQGERDNKETHRYRNSEKVKLLGGYVSSYDWGRNGDGFNY